MFLMNYLKVHIYKKYSSDFYYHTSMFKNYSKHVHKPMNGQVIATPFWFASVGNCSSVMTL